MLAEILLWILAVLCVVVGIAGTIIPALPGTPLVFGGLVLAAWADNFQRVTWITLTILGLLTVLCFVIDFVATLLGAARVGASRQALIGGFVGTIVGIFFGIPGLLLGPFIGAVIGEMMAHGTVEQASRVGVATWLGLIFGTLAKLALTFAMLGIFAFAYFV